MSSTFVLLQLAGYVALLLWGMHMVQSGVLRAFGGYVRGALLRGLDSRWKALLAGTAVTAVTQSSTATSLMASNFVAEGLVGLEPALALILGANIGSTLIVQVASFNVAAVAPLLILAGLIAFKKSPKTRVRDSGRIAIGLGIVLLALHAILLTISPVEKSDGARHVLALISSDPVLNVALGALLAWAALSSVATVLVVMSLAAAHVVTPDAALSLVLGANIGIVIPQYLNAGPRPAARRLALANLMIRGAGALAVLPFLGPLSNFLGTLDESSARQAANFHALFNIALALVFVGLLKQIGWLCEKILPDAPRSQDPGAPVYLKAHGQERPSITLAQAQREVLRIVDMVEAMLQNFADALKADDRKKLLELRNLDDSIDRLHTTIKSHLLTTGRPDTLTDDELRRSAETLSFTINLEHVGDVVDTSLRALVQRKIKDRLLFSDQSVSRIMLLHERVLQQLRLSVSVFLNRGEREARRLLDDKVAVREIAQRATDEHLNELRQGRANGLETSALYVDIIRDLKRISAHLASAAYPILEEKGVLLKSRLVRDTPQAGDFAPHSKPN